MSNYLQHHKEKKKGLFTKTFIVVLIVSMIIITVRIFVPNLFTDISQSMSVLFWKNKNSSVENITNSAQFLRSKKSLIAENNELTLKVKELEFNLLELDFLKQENEFIKKFFGRETFNMENSILGLVLSRPNVSPYDTFVIDIGKNSGIKENNNVYVDGNILIGKVDKVYKNTSIVKLFSSPGEINQVFIGLQNILANAIGRGGGNFIVELPRGSEIKEGDIVTMQGIDIKLFAIVEEVENNSSNPFITIFFKNPVNLNNIKWVIVKKQE